MKTKTEKDEESELESRTSSAETDPRHPGKDSSRAGVCSHQGGRDSHQSEHQADGPGNPPAASSSAGEREPEDESCATPATDIEEFVGILFCCGKRILWIPVEGTTVMDAACDRCGTTYAMDTGEDIEEPYQVGLPLAVVQSILKEACLRADQYPDDRPMFGFTA